VQREKREMNYRRSGNVLKEPKSRWCQRRLRSLRTGGRRPSGGGGGAEVELLLTGWGLREGVTGIFNYSALLAPGRPIRAPASDGFMAVTF
jgi:hypothetical protein